MIAQVSAEPSGIISRLATWLIGRSSPATEKGSGVGNWGHEFDRVKAFAQKHSIRPVPENYELMYRYCILNEPGLDAAIETLILSGCSAVPQKTSEFTEAEVDKLAEVALRDLKSIEAVLARSNKDVEVFGEALEGGVAELASDTSPIDAVRRLVDITRTMVAKSREVRSELRKYRADIGTMRQSLAEARVRADTDGLTGLSNRRSFERELGAASERCKIHGRSLSLAICDIDHFKSVNDRFGHVTGDRVLKLVGQILSSHCEGRGHVFRFGGEEFVVLLPEHSKPEALEIIDGARRDLASRKIVKKDTHEPLGLISFSAGISGSVDAVVPGDLLTKADQALYRAKSTGRNLVLVAGSEVTGADHSNGTF